MITLKVMTFLFKGVKNMKKHLKKVLLLTKKHLKTALFFLYQIIPEIVALIGVILILGTLYTINVALGNFITGAFLIFLSYFLFKSLPPFDGGR